MLEEIEKIIEEFKTIKIEKVDSPPKFIKVESYECLLNNQKKIIREKITKGRGDGSAAIILPITKEGKLLLTIQPRVFTRNTIGIGFPAGYKEENEDYLDAAKRELEEETGYHAEEWIEVCSYYQDDGCSAAMNKGYIALNCEKKNSQHLDPTEFIKYIECSYEEVLKLIEKGYICDGNSLLLLEKLKERKNEYV